MLSSRESVGRIAVTAVALLLVTLGTQTRCHADAGIRVALFKTATDTSGPLAAAVDPVLFGDLSKLPDLEVASRPALDLPSLQLAIDCVGENAECLTQAAQQAQAAGLVAPSVRTVGQETVVSLLYYDARAGMTAPPRTVTRRYPSAEGTDPVLDGLPGMVRELFGIAEPSAAVDDTQPAPAVLPPTASAPAEPPAAHRRVPVVPIVIAAAGVAFLAAGVGFGIAHESVDDKYASTKVTDIASARKADDAYDSSRARALLADVSLGIGAAAVATGVVLFVVQWRDEPTEHAQLRTRLAATPTGLLFTRTWD